MNKEQLKVKLEALEANEAIKREELGVAVSSAQVAREELANINKPKITEDVACELVSNLCRAFYGALSGLDSSDLEIEFSMDYDNRVVVDNISGLDDIDAPESDFDSILSDTFAIVKNDEELEQDDNS
jgi:hypothetical protein